MRPQASCGLGVHAASGFMRPRGARSPVTQHESHDHFVSCALFRFGVGVVFTLRFHHGVRFPGCMFGREREPANANAHARTDLHKSTKSEEQEPARIRKAPYVVPGSGLDQHRSRA